MDEDLSLLQAWIAGDSRAGQALFARRVGEISRFFRNKVNEEQDVADLVSQTFLCLTESRDRFRADASFRRFAFRVAHNVLLNYLRTRYKRAREAVDFSAVCIGELGPKSPSSIMMKQRGAQVFVDALRSLPLDDQVVLELRYFEDLSGPEIADALGRPEGTIRGRLSRATERLRQIVAQRLRQPRPASQDASTVSMDDVQAWAAQVRVALGRNLQVRA